MRPDLLERLKRGVLGEKQKKSGSGSSGGSGATATNAGVVAATTPLPLKPLQLLGYHRYHSNSASTKTTVLEASAATTGSGSEVVAGVAAAELHALRDDWLARFGPLHPAEHRVRLAANWVRATLRNQGAFAGPEGRPQGCLACGGGDRANDPLLPFLRPGGDHDWLHGRCVAAVAEQRTEAVEAAMRAAGIEPPEADAARWSLITPGGLPEGFEVSPPAHMVPVT